MYLLFYIATLASILTGCFILGVYIWLRDVNSPVNRIFFAVSLLLDLIILITIAIQLVPSAATAVILQSIYNIILFLFLSGSLFFTVVFSRQRFNRVLLAGYVIYGLVLSAAFILNGSAYLNIFRINGLHVYELKNNGFWFFFYSPFLAITFAWMIITLITGARRSRSLKERRQSVIMMISIYGSFILGFLVLMILPACKMYRVPLLTPYFFAMYMAGVFYAIVRHNFLSFGIHEISHEILAQIHEIVILIDYDGRVIDANEYFATRLAQPVGSIRGKLVNSCIENRDEVSAVIDTVQNTGTTEKCRVIYRKGRECFTTDSAVSIVHDRFGDSAAILLVSRENRGMDQFQKTYKLTARELSVITMALAGKSDAEISECMGIARRTVETHLANIYAKLSVNNKIELANLVNDFGCR